MLYKVDPMGYFGRMPKYSRGPWFDESKIEDDGLEYFYNYVTERGVVFLLSNNIPIEDRDRLQRFYHAVSRNYYLNWFAGLWAGMEVVGRMQCFRQMAVGWRLLSVLGIGYVVKGSLGLYQNQYYGPVMNAYFRKYDKFAKTDPFDISDRKREYFYIDTSQYMNYTNEELGHTHHVNHGPQPEGEALDSTWLVEMDKFLRGEPNHFKDHKYFAGNYNYEYIDKSYPTVEAAHELFTKPVTIPKRRFDWEETQRIAIKTWQSYC